MNKYNKELIEKLRSGEIALEYDGKSLEDLRAIIKEAFPEDLLIPSGGNIYYIKRWANNNKWDCIDGTRIPNKKITLIKDFIQEEFVLPERWAIKNDVDKIVGKWFDENKQNSIQDYALKYTNKYFHYPAIREKEYSLDNEYFHAFSEVQEGYTEITFQEFQKYVLKQDNNMENKEIIGYLAPYDIPTLETKKGDIFVGKGYKTIVNSNYYYNKPNFDRYGSVSNHLPKEIVEKWEPCYKIKEQVFNMGTFEVVVRDGKAFHNSEDITGFVKDLVTYYTLRVNEFAGYDALIEDITFKKTGCQSNITKLSDWKKVYDALNQ